MEDVQELLKTWVGADVRAIAAEKKVTEMELSGQRPPAALVIEALKLRAEATAAKDNVLRLVVE